MIKRIFNVSMVILMSFTFISFSDYKVVNAQENKI